MKRILTFTTAAVLATLVGAQPAATNQTIAPRPHVPVQAWQDVRLVALAEIESGTRDNLVGPSGEVSRYQIMAAVWLKYSHMPLTVASNPFTAANVAQSIMADRIAQFGRQPNNLDYFLLWHCPAHVWHPSRIEMELAKRFSNLCPKQ